MKARIDAMRAMAYCVAAQTDVAHKASGEAAKAATACVDLLTPVVKGWCTENAQIITSTGVQVHGGVGYIEETGAAQHMRDARITTIYEGTPGIQANDLVGRKVARDKGRCSRFLSPDAGNAAATGWSAGAARCGSGARDRRSGTRSRLYPRETWR